MVVVVVVGELVLLCKNISIIYDVNDVINTFFWSLTHTRINLHMSTVDIMAEDVALEVVVVLLQTLRIVALL